MRADSQIEIIVVMLTFVRTFFNDDNHVVSVKISFSSNVQEGIVEVLLKYY